MSVILVGTPGCGWRKKYPVEGKIIFPDGQEAGELAGGSVEFESLEDKVSARGGIQADGTFEITTDTWGDGAIPGQHRVLVVPPPAPSVDQPGPPVIDPRFQRFATSGLKVRVERKKNVITLTVERPPARP